MNDSIAICPRRKSAKCPISSLHANPAPAAPLPSPRRDLNNTAATPANCTSTTCQPPSNAYQGPHVMHAKWFLNGPAKARTGAPRSRHPPVARPRDPTLSSASVLLAAAVSGFGVLAMAVRSAVRRGATAAICARIRSSRPDPVLPARTSGNQVSKKGSKVSSDLNWIKFEYFGSFLRLLTLPVRALQQRRGPCSEGGCSLTCLCASLCERSGAASRHRLRGVCAGRGASQLQDFLHPGHDGTVACTRRRRCGERLCWRPVLNV